MEKRIHYLDGLKGWMAVVIVLTHYMIALRPEGYVGFGSGVTGDLREHVLANLPWSLFSNTSISLYLLFGMISFFIVVAYRKAGDDVTVLQRQACKRYFQFVLPVFVATIAGGLLYQFGILQYEGLAGLTGSVWNTAIVPTTDNPGLMLFYALAGIYFNNKVEFLTVLWCMHIIFIGSYLTYGVLALFGRVRYRWVCYAVFLCVAVFYPAYLVFVAGAVCGELWQQKREGFKTGRTVWLGVALVILGLVIGMVPSPFLPVGITLEMTYAVGVLFILSGLILSERIFRFLAWKWAVWFGRYLFSVILVHIFILYTFSLWLYRLLAVYIEGKDLLFGLVAALSMPVVMLCSVGFYRLFELPSRKLAGFVASRLIKDTGGEED